MDLSKRFSNVMGRYTDLSKPRALPWDLLEKGKKYKLTSTLPGDSEFKSGDIVTLRTKFYGLLVIEKRLGLSLRNVSFIVSAMEYQSGYYTLSQINQ